jgi:hypothetical protein
MSPDVLTNRQCIQGERPEMPLRTIAPAQHTAAKVGGFLYLFLMATSFFAELYAHGRLIVAGDAMQTAKNIAANERLFRVGTASELIMFTGDVILLWALYVVLRPINRNVALLAAFLRLVQGAVLGLLNGADYLRAFDAQQLQALVRLFLGVRGTGLQIGFVFLGWGSAVFSYLWFKSRYIPRALAALGIFSSLVLAIVTLAILVFPPLEAVVGLAYMAPLFIYEVGLGIWLLVKGIQAPTERRT